MKKEIYLFRHGQSQANAERKRTIPFPFLFRIFRKLLGFHFTLKLIQIIDKIRGYKNSYPLIDKDIPLVELGEFQALMTGKILATKSIFPDLILCSDFLRARQTTDGILNGIKAVTGKNYTNKILYSKLIVERNGGINFGYPLFYYPVLFPEVNKIYKKKSKYDFCPPGGESIRELRENRIPALLDILSHLNFETLFIVAHGITNSSILSLLTEEDIELVNLSCPNLGVYHFLWEENSGKWILDENFKKGLPIDPSIPITN
ncbi:MAG: histidine phosphatase family protein [Leptospiraceae bacterium]|nr:histidine phosphatase family protein [Leptospiraceae bacterium]